MKITTHLDHISHCEAASGPNWSNRWTYRIDGLRSNRWTLFEESFEVPDEDRIELLKMVRAYLIRTSVYEKYSG